MAATSEPEHFRGRLLLADTRTAFLLANHARHRAIHQVFGLPPEQDNVLTLLALALMAGAFHDTYRRVMAGPPFPTRADFAIGEASLSEAMLGVAGPGSRTTPMLGTLLLAAVLAGGARPVLRKALAGVLGEERRLSFDFHRRYGYLVDPGHWRRRRADRRQQALGAPVGGNA